MRTQTSFGTDTGVVEFWREEDAREAEEALHCLEVQGSNIAVQIYQPRRASNISEFSPTAPTFVPSGAVFSTPGSPSPYMGGSPIVGGGGAMLPSLGGYSPAHSPPRGNPFVSVGRPPVFVHGPGQQVQLAPLSGPGSGSHSGLIDPCNLFIKVSQSLLPLCVIYESLFLP